jgi:hypothetical protein
MDNFVLKSSDTNVCVEAGSVEELANVLNTCPIACVKFHLRRGLNDFAEWTGKSLKNDALALDLRKIRLNESNPEETRKKLVEVLKSKSVKYKKI